MPALKILVVDDSGIVAMKLTKMLTELGHTVVATAKTGQQAIDMYKEHNPDFVTMDITMPDMDGIQATKAIIAENPGALILMVTSHGQEQMVIDAIDAGAKGYALKPFQKEKIGEQIDNILKQYGGG